MDDIVDRLRKRAAAFGVPKVSNISETGTLLAEAADHIEWLRRTLIEALSPSHTKPTPSGEREDYRTKDRTGDTFLCDDYPCPDCGQHKVVGFYFVAEDGHHMHTYYFCTFWPAGTNPDGSYTHRERCGWQGWSIPYPDEEHE